MKMLKRGFLFLLALTMLCSTALAYERDPNINDPGVFPVCKETVKLTVGVGQNANVEDFETNFQTLMTEEKGNFDLEFVIYPGNSSEVLQKLNLIIYAGGQDLPDVVMRGLNDATVYTWAQTGLLADLTDYFENSSYYLAEAVERTGVDFLPMVTSPDGRIYGIPSYNQSIGNEYPGRIWLYTPWMEALGLETPSTTEEFYEVLKAFKTQDPNGNGLADEIPMAGSTDRTDWRHAFMNPFVNMGNVDYYAVEDGQVFAAYTQDGWQEGMRYVKRLVDEELFSPLSFTQDLTQLTAMSANDPTILGGSVYSTMSFLPGGDQRRAEYDGIAPLYNEELGRPLTRYTPSVAGIAMIINANCENIEAAFRLGDIMVSEEYSTHTRWGEAGVDYMLPKEGDVSIYAALGYEPKFTAVLEWGKPQNKHWYQTGPYIRQYNIAGGQIFDGNYLNMELKVAEVIQSYRDAKPDEVIAKLIYTAEEIEQIAEVQANLKAYVDECLSLFVTGVMDIDKDWDQFQQELKVIGVEEVMTVVQTVYDRMYK